MKHRFQENLTALLVFVLVTIFMMYPVSLQPGTSVIGRPFEDAFEYIWYLEWYKQAIFDLRISPLFQPDIFYPDGWNLSFSAFPPIHPLLLAPVTYILGSIVTYNLAIMITCVVAAWAVFCLTKAIGGNQSSSIFAGIVYAFYPQRQVYLAGHLNFLVGTMWLPWMLYGVVKAKQDPSKRSHWLAFAGFALAMSIGGSWHFILLSGTTLLIFSTTYLYQELKSNWRDWMVPFAIFGLVCATVIGPFLWQAAIAHQKLGISSLFSFEGTNASGVSIERFLVPSALNPLVWDLARHTFPLTNGQDGVVTFGYITLILVSIALVSFRPWQKSIKALVAVAVVGLSLMPGLFLHYWGQVVSIHIPFTNGIESLVPYLVRHDGSVAIPMPALILYSLLPPFRTFHSFSRWGLIVVLALAPLAALGLTYVSHRLPTKQTRIVFIATCFVVLLVEFNMQPLPTVTKIAEIQRPVDYWLAAQPEQSVIIEYPLDYAMKGQTLYYTTIHGQKIVHGAGSILSLAYRNRLPLLQQWPSEATIRLLEELNVRYVLINVYKGDRVFEQEQLPHLLTIEQLQFIQRFPTPIEPIIRDIYLFELVDKN